MHDRIFFTNNLGSFSPILCPVLETTLKKYLATLFLDSAWKPCPGEAEIN
jgi:hypothetical protein